ncbi:hypothetical protein D1872_212620 [compost metagenome]
MHIISNIYRWGSTNFLLLSMLNVINPYFPNAIPVDMKLFGMKGGDHRGVDI